MVSERACRGANFRTETLVALGCALLSARRAYTVRAELDGEPEDLLNTDLDANFIEDQNARSDGVFDHTTDGRRHDIAKRDRLAVSVRTNATVLSQVATVPLRTLAAAQSFVEALNATAAFKSLAEVRSKLARLRLDSLGTADCAEDVSGERIGCRLEAGNCFCGWFHRCYPNLVIRNQQEAHVQIDVGVCGICVSMLVMISLGLLAMAILCVVVTRTFLQHAERQSTLRQSALKHFKHFDRTLKRRPVAR